MSSQSQKNVIWTPHPKQIEALERSEFEILYGGARGGGKTDCGIAWMVEYTDNPKFRGLVLRRNAEDLKDWIDRANQLYSQLGAEQKGNPAEFHWPSGAVIRTGHLKDSQAYTKYQGHEYQKILIEELTHIPEENQYLRILSSARTSIKELRPQVFLTTNPGSVGHAWVRRRFVDPKPPGKTIWDKTEMPDGESVWRSRVFIPAIMDDNPTLMENDPQYVANIEALKETDEVLYRAWRYGDWDVFAGQVFREFRRHKHVMPPTVPLNMFEHYLSIDWGYSETSAFAAYASAVIPMKTNDGDKYNRVITYREWYGNQKTPEDWAEIIFEDAREMGVEFTFGYTDPAMHNTQTDGSVPISKLMERRFDQLNGGKRWTKLKKGGMTSQAQNSRIARVATVHNWLSDAPDGLPYWIMTENCENLIRTLPQLVYDENKPEDVDTTQEDHCLLGDTKVVCYDGIKKIKDMVGTTGLVKSLNGEWVRYDNCKKTRKNAELVEVIFEDGSKLICTPGHRILTMEGMIEAQNLKNQECLRSVKQFKSLREKDIINVAATSQDKPKKQKGHKGFTGLFGSIITEKYHQLIMSTTRMGIGAITKLKTWLLLRLASIYLYTLAKPTIQKLLRQCKKRQKNGINQKRGESGTRSTMSQWLTSFIRRGSLFVLTVMRSLLQLLHELSFAHASARQRTGEIPESMMLWSNANSVGESLRLINTIRENTAQKNVLRCTDVKKIDKRADTYCLRADKFHLFSIDNGVLVSNSYDSIGYKLTMIKFISVKPGILHGRKRSSVMRKFDKEGKSIGLDLDKFKERVENKRDWRSL